jgi:hypothetical protein
MADHEDEGDQTSNSVHVKDRPSHMIKHNGNSAAVTGESMRRKWEMPRFEPPSLSVTARTKLIGNPCDGAYNGTVVDRCDGRMGDINGTDP